ncbi:craniofacial development protein 2-like [Sitophilus oryzae]|uniref:Craniofacial development protein 2-like n=1 Tax=Sitophilus oryzae TaxID=7048 RepID=A0A6J2XAE1_SITOR|nr:craniofacial development protein 2-like [Sitophilus oryzae]
MPTVKTRLPQASRNKNSESRIDVKSVCPTDSGGDKHLAKRKTNSTMYVATYNARSLLSEERLTELEYELDHIKWDVVGLCEIRRRGEHLVNLKSGHSFYFVGDENSSFGGTSFLIHKRHRQNIVSLKKISNRVVYLVLRLSTRYEIKIIQVYAPTTDHPDEEVDIFYDDVDFALKDERTHFTILRGDFNAKMGTKSYPTETSLGGFGLGDRNERGETLLGFLLQNNLFQMNSFFQKRSARKWTWKSPDGRTKNEIDFIITDKRHIVKDLTVLNKLTTRSDHRLVRARIELNTGKERLKMIKKAGSRSWTKPADLEGFQRCITEQLQDYTQENSIDGLNENITNALLESQNRYCPKTQREEKLSKFTKRLMDKRRATRSEQLTTVDELRDINKQISKAIRK